MYMGKYRFFDIGIAILIWFIGTGFGVNWDRVLGTEKDLVIDISPDEIIEESKIPQNIDGRPLSKTQQISASPEIFEFRMVHRIPGENYREEFAEIFGRKYVVISLNVTDFKDGKKRTYTKSCGIADRHKDDYFKDELITFLNLIDFPGIKYKENPGNPGDIRTITKFELNCSFEGKNIHREIEITNIDDKLAEKPNDDIFKLKFLMVDIERMGYSYLWGYE